MLHKLFSWKTYRTIKNGMLLDFYVKKYFIYMMNYIYKVFTIYFFDKYILETLLQKLITFKKYYNSIILTYTKLEFVKYFKVVLLYFTYLVIIYIITLIIRCFIVVF